MSTIHYLATDTIVTTAATDGVDLGAGDILVIAARINIVSTTQEAVSAAGAGASIANNGEIFGADHGIVSSDLTSPGATVSINNGTGGIIDGINGAISIATDYHFIVNHGQIGETTGAATAIATQGAGAVYNFGSIDGEVSDADALSTDSNYFYNSGTLDASLAPGGAAPAASKVFVGSSAATERLDNSGTIVGEVDLGGGSGSALYNSGSIVGNVHLGAGAGELLQSTLGTISGAIYGGDGGDTIVAGQTGGTVIGGAGNDTLYANPTVNAVNNTAHTVLDGGGGTNFLYGDGAYTTFMAGDDTTGIEHMTGEASTMPNVVGYSNNTVSYADLPSGQSAHVNLNTGVGLIASTANALSGPYRYEDTLANIQNVIGSSGSDVIVCSPSVSDTVTGGAGGDYFYPTGSDTFVYKSITDSQEGANDWIVEPIYQYDKIDLSAFGLDSSHLLIQDNGVYHAVILEKIAGTFNPATDLYIGVQTHDTTPLPRYQIIL